MKKKVVGFFSRKCSPPTLASDNGGDEDDHKDDLPRTQQLAGNEDHRGRERSNNLANMQHCGLRNSVTGEPIPMTKENSSAEIIGYSVHMEIECAFTNDQSKSDAEEVIFNYPLESKAALFDFRAVLNGVETIAMIKGKETAIKEYESAVREKRTAALLSEKNDYTEVFEIKLGALPQGETITIYFSFARQLETVGLGNNNIVSFTHQRLLDNKYEVSNMGKVEPFQRQLSWQEEQNQDQESDSQMQDCDSQLSIYTDSDECKIRENKESSLVRVETDENRAGSTYRARSNTVLKHVSLDIYHRSDEPSAVIEPGHMYPGLRGGFLGSSIAMVTYPTTVPADPSLLSKEFIIIVDRSRSMNEHLMGIARQTVVRFLRGLPATYTDCYFNIVSFGDELEIMSKDLQPCTSYNLMKAIRIVRGFRGDLGGANLLKPLKWAMDLKSFSKSFSINRSIVVVTAGRVDKHEEVVTYCNKKREDKTIYAFGIGPGADEKLVVGVADDGFGYMTGRTGQDCVELALNRAQKDFYRNIDVKFEMPKEYSCHLLHTPKVLIPGEKLVVFALIQYRKRELRRPWEKDDLNIENGVCEITFSKPGEPDKPKGMIKSNIELVVRHKYDDLLEHLGNSQILLNELLSFIQMGLPIHRLAAKRRILELSFEVGMESEVEALSLQTNVLSPVTAFVAVIDGKDHKAEGTKIVLEFPPGSARNAKANDQVKSAVIAEQYEMDRDDSPTGGGGMECHMTSDHVEIKIPPKTEFISDEDLPDFKQFSILYGGVFSKLQRRYSCDVPLVPKKYMYDEVMKQGIKIDDWASFIKKRLTTMVILVIWEGTERELKVKAYASVDNLISSICKEFSSKEYPISKDNVGEMKIENGPIILRQKNVTLIELGLRNKTKLLVNKQ